MTKKRIGTIESLQMIVVIVLFGLKLIPKFQYTYAGLTWSLVYQLLFLLWLLLTMGRSRFWFQKLRGYLVYVFLWLLLLGVEFLLFPNTQIGFFGLNLTFWEPLIIYYYYTEIDDNPNVMRVIAIIAIAMLFYGLVQSIMTVNVNALAAREASSGHSSDDAVLTGNYSFTATLTVLMPLWIGVLVTKHNKYVKISSAVLLLSSIYFIFHCNLLISIICMSFSIISFFLFGEKREISGTRVLIFILAVFFLLFTAAYWKNVILFLLNLLDTTINTKALSIRIAQLEYLLNGVLIGNVSSRFELDLIALRTFSNHPLFGIGPQNNANIYFLTQLGFHATLFDDLARYGIIGFGVLAMAYLRYIDFLLHRFNNTNGCRVVKASFSVFVLISMLNPTTSANLGIALFFIIPTLCMYNNNKQELREESGRRI